MPISIFLICFNEVDRIEAAIAAVRGLTDDIVVTDSGSSDGTREMAERLGAKVFLNTPFPGYGPQKRFAEDRCRHDWVLNIDADEIVPSRLAEEIRTLFRNGEPAADAYRIPIAEIFPGEGTPHPWAYTLKPVRLYRLSRGRYVESTVHDRVALEPGARIGDLKTAMHHFSVRSLGDQIAKLNAYSDMQAADLEKRGVSLPSWRIFTEFPLSFLKAYVIRRHFVRGVYGFMTAMNYAFSRHLRLAKHIEQRRLEKR
ncbi:putative glycosyltransferase RP128 [Agaricicola taiwanensis]|uniref:Putative glycosyltransferase RP128 n=1 Tax=Agaricicola taiwanensis TaxID=591372 RepID=A0A8J2YGP9_9RHOB|nr:glycosyltransferase family 2 protein [Agaricicola taiwanensis]GGE40343.1 putative glycosyltransferase RP128 [Agaricicola taiwanensis]